MPQFDFFSFFVQVFWFSVGSFVLYLVYLMLVLKNTAQVIKMRQKINYFVNKIKENKSTAFIYNSTLEFFKKLKDK
jgi:hypothetical protein